MIPYIFGHIVSLLTNLTIGEILKFLKTKLRTILLSNVLTYLHGRYRRLCVNEYVPKRFCLIDLKYINFNVNSSCVIGTRMCVATNFIFLRWIECNGIDLYCIFNSIQFPARAKYKAQHCKMTSGEYEYM